mmetsp:Transcript_75576/g.204014  ORF Transcript_75576/g.204014 Transcript_75576/m.204014 type:complete len:622 (+) Transcript_75576:204-2069(+)
MVSEGTPAIEDLVPPVERQLPVLAVRATHENEIAAPEQPRGIDEVVAPHVHICAQHLGSLPKEEPSELEGQRLSEVVVVGLESHAENATSRAGQLPPLLREVPPRELEHAVRHCLVDEHGSVAQGEGVPAVSSQLHGVLEETRPSSEARARKPGRTGVVVNDGRANSLEVEALRRRDVVELICSSKHHVAPGVEEKLGGLGLLELELDEVDAEGPEESLGMGQRSRRRAGDDLRQLAELPKRLALGDSLGAEAHADASKATLLQRCADPGRGPGEKRRAEHQRLSVVPQMRTQRLDTSLDHRKTRVQVLIHRCADRHNDYVALSHRRVLVRERQALRELLQAPGQKLRAPSLQKRKLASADGIQLRTVHVNGKDVMPTVCQDQRQWQPNMTSAADDGNFEWGLVSPERLAWFDVHSWLRMVERTPAIEDQLRVTECEVLVALVRTADKHDVTPLDQAACVHEVLAVQVRIGAAHLGALPAQQPAQLEGERLAAVVAIGLECHPQDAALRPRERPARERQLPLGLIQEAVGHSLVDQHGRMAEGERVATVRGQLHVVLEEPRPCSEPGAREAQGPAVAVHDRFADTAEVQALAGRDVVELVGSPKDDISPSVQEEHRNLGLQ